MTRRPTMDHQINYPPGGDIQLDGTKLTGDQVSALLQSMLATGRLEEYLSPFAVPADLEGWAKQVIDRKKAGDVDGMVTAFSGFCHAVMGDAGMTQDAE